MKRLLVTGDWHADRRTFGVPRFQEVSRAVGIAIGEAIKAKCDGFVFLGDLCDPDSAGDTILSIELLMWAAAMLSGEGIRSFWLAGNHDVVEDGSGVTTISPLRSLDRSHAGLVHVFERPKFMKLDGWPGILALPFTATAAAYDPVAFASEVEGRDNITLGHLLVAGVLPGEETYEMPRGREIAFPMQEACSRSQLVLHGHYHRRQVTPEKIIIPGTLARLTFGEEANEPGFVIVEAR